MATVIRSANLDTDRGLLITAIGRWLTPGENSQRFDWLYGNSPHGLAQVWIATQGQAGPLIGAAAAFPRKMYAGSKKKMGCVLGDFFVVPEYRSLGPAIQLQRACLAAAGPASFEFCYDFPAAAMVPVYRRLAIESQEKLVRLAKPLKINKKVRDLVNVPLIANSLSAPANAALAARDRVRPNHHQCEISVHTSACGAEFTELAASLSGQAGICTERSAEHLNWRYCNHYSRRYDLLVARRAGRLLAYLIYTRDGEDAEIADLFGINETEVLAGLIMKAVDLLRSEGAATVSAPMLSVHPWVGIFERLGFHERESCPVMIYSPRANGAEFQPEKQSWFLMQGDRES